jgi:hypothetical protein
MPLSPIWPPERLGIDGDEMTSNDDRTSDGVSRRKVLECMTWAGTGVLWTLSGGIPRSFGMDEEQPA